MFIIRMMKKFFILYVLIVAIAGFFISCDEGDDIWSSAAMLEMTTDFSVQADKDTISVDFANGDIVTFKGAWNKESDWRIVIVGNESNHTDTLYGCSQSLDGVSWNGTTAKKGSYFPYTLMNKKFAIDLFGKATSTDESSFVEGESCIVMLQFDDYEGVDTSKVVVKIASKQENYTKKDYCIVADWNGNSELYTNSGATFKNTIDGEIVPEGKKCCVMEGKESGSDWYIDGMGFTFEQVNNWVPGFYPISLKDTATTYLNFFMYGFPEYCENTSIFISLINSDEANSKEIECDLQGDRISVSAGWHGVSIPISRFKTDNAEFDYDKINKMTVVLFSQGKVGTVKTAVDFIVITKKATLFEIKN